MSCAREWTLDCLFHQPPKFYNIIFLFVALKTLATLLNFEWYVHKVKCLNVSTFNCNLQKG